MSFRLEVGYGEEEEAVYELYKAQGMIEKFYELKPILTGMQLALLGAFYRMSQERTMEQGAPYPIKDSEIRYYQKYNGSCSYAPDLFIIGIRAIDSEYIKNRCELMRQESKKGR